MTLYMLLAGLGIVIYIGLAYAEAVVSGYSSPFFAFLSNVLAALFLFCAYRLLRKHSYSIGRASAWRRRIVVPVIVFYAGGVAILIAATREPGAALTCAGPCGGSQAAVVGSESARALAAGRTLFHERGCVDCHEPDRCGVGPALDGLFGSRVQDPGGGVATVDERYLREAILNPSATVAEGFPPIMPTFAGQLTEEELQALIMYLKSLSVPVQLERR